MEHDIFDQQAQVSNVARSSNKVEIITADEKALVCQHNGDSQS